MNSVCDLKSGFSVDPCTSNDRRGIPGKLGGASALAIYGIIPKLGINGVIFHMKYHA